MNQNNLKPKLKHIVGYEMMLGDTFNNNALKIGMTF
jgi:hypothetical protein